MSVYGVIYVHMSIQITFSVVDTDTEYLGMWEVSIKNLFKWKLWPISIQLSINSLLSYSIESETLVC